MHELRQDPLTGLWTIMAPLRNARPAETTVVQKRHRVASPFLEGSEGETPPEVFAVRDAGSKPDGPGWRVRVVPNRYPATDREAPLERVPGVWEGWTAAGVHEVIVETTDPEQPLSRMGEGEIALVLEAWRARMVALREDARCAYVQIFKNQGAHAGATIRHAHSQLIALPHVPAAAQTRIARCAAYWAREGRDLFEAIVAGEAAPDGPFFVGGNAAFVAYRPWASRVPREVRVVRRQKGPCFGEASDADLAELSGVLRGALREVDRHGEASFNIGLHSAPQPRARGAYPCLERSYRWHVEILPRMSPLAGFELATGYFINGTLPEAGS